MPEPGNPQDLNRYAYVRNNPVGYIDPTGHQGEPPGDYDWWDAESRLAVALDATPGADVSPSRQAIAQQIGIAEIGLDAMESIISIVGSGASAETLALGGAAAQFEPTPFGEGAVTLVAFAETMTADVVEDLPGSVDVFVNTLGDVVGGSTYRDTSTNEWVIGQDTLLTYAEQSWDFAIPSSWADLVLNASSTGYDLTKLIDWMPEHFEMRVPIDPDTGLPIFSENYLVLYPDALPEDARARRAMLRLFDLEDE